MKLQIILFFFSVVTISSSAPLLDRLSTVGPIELAALGRVATLRMSLINGNYSSFIKSTDERNSQLKYLKLNTLHEKLDSLNIQVAFKLSVLSGALEVSGSGKFISDKKQSSRSAKVSVANFVTTKFENVDMSDPNVLKLINTDVLQKIHATHVVVGVEWGGNVVVSVEDLNLENQDKQTVEGNLAGKLERVVASISNSGGANITEDELKQFSQFSFELYGDVLPTELPTTLVEAIVLMKSLPQLLTEANDGKGKELTYTMLPISLLRELLSVQADDNSFVASIDGSTVNSCIKLLEEMDVDQLKINDLLRDLNHFHNFISKEKMNKVNGFANSYHIYQIKLKRRLAEKLIVVKSGNETVSEIIDILNEAYSHELSPLNIDFDQFLSIRSEFKYIQLLVDLNVNVLDRTTTLNEFMSIYLDKSIYAFFYAVDFPNFSDAPVIEFRSILEMRNGSDTEDIFVAIKVDVLRGRERRTYFNFTEPTRLRMYRNGVCIIDDYSTISHPPNESESPLRSLPYMQAQIGQLTADINAMKDNPVPVHYTYVQYPDMPEPGQLWPSVKWIDITPRYAGLFFRAEGGSANCFNCTTQEDRSPRITGVLRTHYKDTLYNYVNITYQTDEESDRWLGAGSPVGDRGGASGITFRTKHNEVIPRNKSIRMWQRIE